MTDVVVETLEAEITAEDADRGIEKAVSGRRSIARKYVKWVRRKNPDATPAEVIAILERQYGTSITIAGAAISASVIAIDVGIALIPIAGPAAAGAKSAGQQAAKKAGAEATKLAAKQATKAAAKNLALGAAKTGAQRVATLLPAGDEQLQFEITAIFALALAEIHGMDLDDDQSQALVYGLSNGRVSSKIISAMAADVADSNADGVVAIGQNISSGRGDWSHWADTLANSLPGGAAQSLVRTMQTGELDTVRGNLSGKQQAAVEYGAAAVAGGITRFVFGKEVVEASRQAFAEAPEEFPPSLAAVVKVKESDSDIDDVEGIRAIAALKEAASVTGGWVAGAAGAVGGSVASTAGKASRPFRSVDLDGDGIPDEAQALTAAKDVGSAIAGAAGRLGGGVTGLFRSGRRGRADRSLDREDGDAFGEDESSSKTSATDRSGE